MKKPSTPFPTSGYYGSEYFCDRVEEAKQLREHIESGQSTIVMAIRRIGKTGLMQHVMSNLDTSKYESIYIDILPTENMNELLNSLATAIAHVYPMGTQKGNVFSRFIKAMSPTINFDPYSGLPQLSFSVQQTQTQKHIQQILLFLNEQKKRIVIAIDEFQQILSYPEKNADAWFRTQVQQLDNVVFIFSGSQQHLIGEMFNNPARPFYRSASIMKLDKIKKEVYCAFITKHFANFKMNMSDEVAYEILDWACDHTFYVQTICNRTFMQKKKVVTTELWRQEAYKILKEQEQVFYNFRHILTKSQWSLLKSMALEGKVYAPTGQEFVSKYSLGNPASVLRALEALVKKELIYVMFDQDGNRFYNVYDVFFYRWIKEMQQ